MQDQPLPEVLQFVAHSRYEVVDAKVLRPQILNLVHSSCYSERLLQEVPLVQLSYSDLLVVHSMTNLYPISIQHLSLMLPRLLSFCSQHLIQSSKIICCEVQELLV